MSFVSALAFALLHSLWQVALIALIAALGFSSLHNATPRLRHALGMGCLVAMLLAPIVTFVICWQAPSSAPLAAGSWLGTSGAADPRTGVDAARFATPWSDWLLVCLAQLWLAGVAVMAVAQVGGWRLLRQVERQPFVELPPPWQRRVAVLAAALGITRRVSVRLGPHITSPFTAHAIRPLIWLPLTLLTQLPANQIEALLAHELAHIRRLDWCWNALQRGIELLLFHHPAMWWLSQRVRDEREHACDDLAVTVCGDAVVLAEALTGLRRRNHRSETLVPGLRAEGGSLMKRISHLLQSGPRGPNWRPPAALLLLLCTAGLIAMQVAPPAHLLTNVRFDASSSGALTRGNHREISASYLGEKQRRYRVDMDAQGQVAERYTEDGQPRAIDAGVRQWLSAMTAMNSPPAPPRPPPALAPPAPAPAPAIADPARPESMSDESIALMQTIVADRRLVAMTGLPVSFERHSFRGRIHTWGSREFHLWGIDDPVAGRAAFTMTFQGPKGRVNVTYAGRTASGGIWKADTLELTPLPG